MMEIRPQAIQAYAVIHQKNGLACLPGIAAQPAYVKIAIKPQTRYNPPPTTSLAASTRRMLAGRCSRNNQVPRTDSKVVCRSPKATARAIEIMQKNGRK